MENNATTNEMMTQKEALCCAKEVQERKYEEIRPFLLEYFRLSIAKASMLGAKNCRLNFSDPLFGGLWIETIYDHLSDSLSEARYGLMVTGPNHIDVCWYDKQ